MWIMLNDSFLSIDKKDCPPVIFLFGHGDRGISQGCLVAG